MFTSSSWSTSTTCQSSSNVVRSHILSQITYSDLKRNSNKKLHRLRSILELQINVTRAAAGNTPQPNWSKWGHHIPTRFCTTPLLTHILIQTDWYSFWLIAVILASLKILLTLRPLNCPWISSSIPLWEEPNMCALFKWASAVPLQKQFTPFFHSVSSTFEQNCKIKYLKHLYHRFYWSLPPPRDCHILNLTSSSSSVFARDPRHYALCIYYKNCRFLSENVTIKLIFGEFYRHRKSNNERHFNVAK